MVASKLDRVKNGLSTVSNQVSPAHQFLPPPPPPTQRQQPATALLSSSMMPGSPIVEPGLPKVKAKRPTPKKKKDGLLKNSAAATASPDAPVTVTGADGNVFIKNRFKHSRPVLVGQNMPDVKRPKTALDMISSNYNTVSSPEHGIVDNTMGVSDMSERYVPVGCAQTSVYTAVHGSEIVTAAPAYAVVSQPPLLQPLQSDQQQKIKQHAHAQQQLQKQLQQQQNSLRAVPTPTPFCPTCRTSETCIPGPNYFKCLNCNQQFTTVARSIENPALPTVSSNAKSFYSLAHLPQVSAAAHGGVVPPPPAPKRRPASSSSKKKKKHVETVDLVSDSDGEEDEELEGVGASSSSSIPNSVNSGTTKIADRMKVQGGTLPPNPISSGKNHTLTTASQNRTTTPTPPPTTASPSPTPAPDNTPGEYKFECGKAMFGELYGETLAATRCADNRIYLSLQCQMVRDSHLIPEKYTLSVGHNDVQQILIHFGRAPSFVAIETSARFAEVACKRIGKEVLVPGSADPKKRYIILALKAAFKLDAEASVELSTIVNCLSPWAKLNVLPLETAQKLIIESTLDVDQKEECFGSTKPKPDGPVETLFHYQKGAKSGGGIPVTTEDRACLAEGTYLNDIIIDFYLKYLYEDVLTEDQRSRTYIFNSYFYKRLTQKQGTKFSPDQMHGLVKKWTRNVDVFEKDYVIIPVNEHCHWYLVVICFPGGAFVCDDDLSEKEEEEEDDENADFLKETKSSDEESDKNGHSNGSDAPMPAPASPTTTLTSNMIPPQIPTSPSTSPSTSTTDQAVSPNKSDSDDTATTPSSISNSADEQSNGTATEGVGPALEGEASTEMQPGAAPLTPVKEKVIYKQANESEEFVRPCILIFDSLVGSGHSRVFTNLRHYLTVEWALRKPDKPPRVFDKTNMKGCYPKIPRQNNDCDCGVFLLQYVESFFSKCIKSFRIPVHLEQWFTQEYVSKKRQGLQTLINTLAEKEQEAKDELKQS